MAVTRAEFERYLRDNPKVYELFERYALEAAKCGKRIGAKAIWERMRWYAQVETKDPDGYKLNNNYTSWMVRKFREDHPGYGMVFSVRQSQADESSPRAPAPPPPKPSPRLDRQGQAYMPGMV